MHLTATARGDVAQKLTSTTSKRGLDREAWEALSVLRVRTEPECPENNLRELIERENFPLKGSNSKPGLLKEESKYQRRASQLHTGPSPGQRQRSRHETATARARRQRAAPILAPGTCTLHQIVSRLPVASQFFLGSWMVDICQEVCSLRSAPQRRHTAHLRQCSCCAPNKPSGWDRGGD